MRKEILLKTIDKAEADTNISGIYLYKKRTNEREYWKKEDFSGFSGLAVQFVANRRNLIRLRQEIESGKINPEDYRDARLIDSNDSAKKTKP